MKIQITNTLELMSFDRARAGKRDTHVYFVLDGQGPFEVVIPSEELTDDKIKEEVNAFATKWKHITSMNWETS